MRTTGKDTSTVLTLLLEYKYIKEEYFAVLFINSFFFKQSPTAHSNAALSATASYDPHGGLLEDTVVPCCEAVATYVCTTWFPWGNHLIGYGCWSLSPICELSLNLDIVSPWGKTHHSVDFTLSLISTYSGSRK